LTYYEAGEIFPGSPGGVFIKERLNSYQNGSGARGWGGEINLDFSVNERISGFVNYSYRQITQKEDNPYTIGFNEKDRVRPEYPKHKINAGLRLSFKNGIAVNFLGHWVDKSERFIIDSSEMYSYKPVDDYFIFNSTVVYTSRDEKTELAFSVSNLFNHKHYQYPGDENLAVPHSDRVGRRITFSFGFKF
jgi:outer membrane receptor for ferrienterochelin and colicin